MVLHRLTLALGLGLLIPAWIAQSIDAQRARRQPTRVKAALCGGSASIRSEWTTATPRAATTERVFFFSDEARHIIRQSSRARCDLAARLSEMELEITRLEELATIERAAGRKPPITFGMDYRGGDTDRIGNDLAALEETFIILAREAQASRDQALLDSIRALEERADRALQDWYHR